MFITFFFFVCPFFYNYPRDQTNNFRIEMAGILILLLKFVVVENLAALRKQKNFVLALQYVDRRIFTSIKIEVFRHGNGTFLLLLYMITLMTKCLQRPPCTL